MPPEKPNDLGHWPQDEPPGKLSDVMPKWFLAFAPVVAAVLSGGCSAPPEPTARTLVRVSADSPEAYDHLWNAIGDTLRHNYYRIDREDRLERIITTYPETSAHFIELWRPQPPQSFYWWESNLHTIQRQAAVTLTPVEEAGTYELAVDVTRSRYNLEERQIDNSAGALRLFSADAPTVSGKTERPSSKGEWTPLGRDKSTEEQLLTAILHHYDMGTTVETQPAEDTVATPATKSN